MYTGYELTERARNQLRDIFPPKYTEFLGHHITEKFGVKDPNQAPEQPQKVEVVGHADDNEGIEGLLVAIDDNINRPDGSLYHITWSLDRSKGYSPVDTNKIIKNADRLSKPIQISAVAKFFSGSTKQEMRKQTLTDFVNTNSLTYFK